MNIKFKNALFLMSICTLFSCEDVVKLDVPRNEEKIVVDAQINDKPSVQTIKIMLSQAYFNNDTPPPATGAIAKVTDNEGNSYIFSQRLDKDNKPTEYFDWKPKANETLGKIGRKYTLEIVYNGETYQSVTEMRPVPKIDSLVYSFKDNSNLPGAEEPKKGYRPEFFARDITGAGDCYFIKGYRYFSKDKSWKKDRQQIAYDAAFQPGARADGLVFILPIRRSITNDLLQEGDSMRVELYSITEPHFNFLRAADADANNQGLFATPPATFPTNIVNLNKNSTKKALGWFSASGLNTLQVIIDPKKATPDTD